MVVVAATPVVVLASCGMAGVVQPQPASPAAGTRSPSAPTPAPSQPQGRRAGVRPSRRGPALTSCRGVVHIGDSTSEGLISPGYLPDPRERIGAQYAEVGVTRFIPEISGARSIVETYHGQPNAYTVAQQLIQRGYRGCWVLAWAPTTLLVSPSARRSAWPPASGA